jgi:glucose/arabinose dehydrogenase
MSGGEMGLLGLAFDPNYAANGFFYVNYTTSQGGLHTVIARYQVTADPDVADAASETILLQYSQPFENHNGGCLAFGQDGNLYIAAGDGGGGGDPSGNGQSLTTVLGKILRITNTGAIPGDNPFAGMGGGVRGEIWAYGMRNPWRFSFDRTTGDLWCGDVGQNAIEEIDLVVKGGNYGWNLFEGDQDYDNPGNVNIDTTERPIVTYTHSLGEAVTGGYVYRGTGVPSLVGSYVYADFGSGRIWALVYDGSNVVSNVEIAGVSTPSSFGEDFDGELYICSFSGNIYRFAENP